MLSSWENSSFTFYFQLQLIMRNASKVECVKVCEQGKDEREMQFLGWLQSFVCLACLLRCRLQSCEFHCETPVNNWKVKLKISACMRLSSQHPTSNQYSRISKRSEEGHKTELIIVDCDFVRRRRRVNRMQCMQFLVKSERFCLESLPFQIPNSETRKIKSSRHFWHLLNWSFSV